MGIYNEARARTRSSIENAFWNLYTRKDSPRITVRAIVESAGIHRATFYMYYDNVEAVLDSIMQRQLKLLLEICTMPRNTEIERRTFLNTLQKLFHDNRCYLEPLVCEYKDNRFALEYRNIIKKELHRDFGLPFFQKGTRDDFIVEAIMTAFTETILQGLKSELMTMEDLFQLISGCMQHGGFETLQNQYHIAANLEDYKID